MHRQNQHFPGFTLLEAMLLMVIISIVAVAAGVGLQAVAKSPENTAQILAVNNALVNQMEQWTAKSWSTMNPSSPFATPYSTSSTLTISGKSYSCSVTVADDDPSNPEGGVSIKTDFRKITVTCTPSSGGMTQSMVCYVTQP